MNDNLSCALVRDLLPSYLEGLTAEETNEALNAHLEHCPACAAALAAMRGTPEPEEAPREVNYLKRVKRRSAQRIALAVVCTALVLLGGFALKLFVIGTPLQVQTLAVMDAQEDHGRLRLDLSSMASANAYHGWKVEVKDGVACIYAREVLVSGLYSSGQARVYVPLEGVEEVWLGGISGKLVWQDGMAISQQTLDLLDARTPYCGNPSALGEIARALRMQESYTVSMDTSMPPYRWTLELYDSPNSSRQAQMIRYAYLMLALVDNLDEVAWTWKDLASGESDGENVVFRDTASRRAAELTEEYNALHGTKWAAQNSIQDYTQSPAEFQRLLTLLELP